MKQFLGLFFVFSSLFVTIGYSQKISFVTYGTNEGLPQSQVTSIVQDNNGYLWVGTLGGLARFNGKDFVTYSTRDGLFSNRITSLAIIDNVIWVGHQNGISCLSKKKVRKWRIPEFRNRFNVTKIIQFKHRVLISTNGAGLFELVKNKWIKRPILKLIDEAVYGMTSSSNKLYLAVHDGILESEDGFKFKKIKALNGKIITGISLEDDQLCIATYLEGCYKFHLKENKIFKINQSDNLQFYISTYIDSKHNAWYIATNGLLKVKPNKRIEIFDVGMGLSGPFNTVFEDKHKNIWVCTDGKGLMCFPSEKIVYFDQSCGFSSDLVTSINQDSKGNLWFSSFDKGIFRMFKSSKIESLNITQNLIWTSLLDIDHLNWFGTENGLIQINKNKIVNNKNLPKWKITTLLKIDESSMYIGGKEGLLLYKNGKYLSVKDQQNPNINIGLIRDIELLDKNKIYCASDKGLFLYCDNKFHQIEGLSSIVSCIQKDEMNQIWVGTEEGLYMLVNNQLKKIEFSSQPSSNFIVFLNYRNKKIYVGTNNGLFVYNQESNEFLHFGKQEGLVDLECNINSSFFDRLGRFWFGTASGTVLLDTRFLKMKTIKPFLVINELLLNHEMFDYSRYSTLIDRDGLPRNLRLPYSKNNITVQLDGILMNNHNDLQYQYWIEGLDDHWSPPTTNKTISFTSLPSGDYTLHFRALVGKNGYSNEITIPLIIKAPFYFTWWFILLCLLFIFFVVYSVVQLKIKREREKNERETLEYKSKLIALEQKSLNASMNRHFIFNALNSIQYFINSQDRLSANRYLTNFAKLIRKNLDSTVEDGSMITLNQELEGLELYLSLEAMRFKGKFDYEIDVEDIDTESIKVPSMLLQPFIENSIIHGILPDESKKGLIRIHISLEDQILHVQIDDNGVGIDKSLQTKHEMAGDHKSQGMEITSKRIDLIKKLSNQGFELIGPFQITEKDGSINGTRVLLKIPVNNLEY